jgi:hypothetical protein
MVIGSVMWIEGAGLGLARSIVQRYALETRGEQGFIGEKSRSRCNLDRSRKSHDRVRLDTFVLM